MCPRSRSRSHPKGRPETDPYSGKMATALRLPLRLCAAKLCVAAPKPGARAAHLPRWTQNRTAVSTPSGAILPKPDKVSLILSRLPTAEAQRSRPGGPKLGQAGLGSADTLRGQWGGSAELPGAQQPITGRLRKRRAGLRKS